MKLFSTSLLLFINILFCASQDILDKGYFIDNNAQKVECYIKNIDWKNNPKEFKYSLTPSADNLEKNSIATVQEFGIYNICKYIRKKVLLDRSLEDLSQLSLQRNPEYKEEILFLKVLLEGPASLYQYSEYDLNRFFYKSTNSDVTQLIYKKYSVNNTIGENFGFRQQLWTEINCNKRPLQLINKIPYQVKPLIKHFNEHNICKGDTSVEYNKKVQRDYFNLKITPGINYTTINIVAGDRDIDQFDCGSKFAFKLGVEGEFILPYNRGKWRFVLNPTFEYFNSDPIFPLPYTRQLKYKTIEFPIGVRYYSYVTQDVKLFYNAFFIPSWSYNFNTIVKSGYGAPWKVDPASSFALGAGVEWKRFSFEGRYYSNRNLFRDFFTDKSSYTRWAIVLGYKIILTSANNGQQSAFSDGV